MGSGWGRRAGKGSRASWRDHRIQGESEPGVRFYRQRVSRDPVTVETPGRRLRNPRVSAFRAVVDRLAERVPTRIRPNCASGFQPALSASHVDSCRNEGVTSCRHVPRRPLHFLSCRPVDRPACGRRRGHARLPGLPAHFAGLEDDRACSHDGTLQNARSNRELTPAGFHMDYVNGPSASARAISP